MVTTSAVGPIHIERQIPPRAHSPMYVWHKYWARKSWNVVGAFIEAYCPPGGVIIDPFAGSGVTGMEAIKRGRRAILVDVIPLMEEVVWSTLVDVDTAAILRAFGVIEKKVAGRINELYETQCPTCGTVQTSRANVWHDGFLTALRYICKECGTRWSAGAPVTEADLHKLEEVKGQLGQFPFPANPLEYPDGQPFVERQKYRTLADVFTPRNLHALSMLMAAIEEEPNRRVRRILKATFTSMVHLASRMVPALDPGPGNHQTPFSSTWTQQSYWSAPRALEQNVWGLFASAVTGHQGIIRAKEDSAKSFAKPPAFARSLEAFLAGEGDIYLHTGDSASLLERIPHGAIDYCFTDPPYDASIQYGELAFMWVAWLGKDRGYLERISHSEVVRNERQHKDAAVYRGMLGHSFELIFGVLRDDSYLTVTFHNPSLAVRKATIEAGTFAGFILDKIHHQPLAVKSAKSLLQPFGSAQGDFYLRFHKLPDAAIGQTPTTVDDVRFERVVVDTTKQILAERGEPTSYTFIINKIDPELAKRGFFSSLTSGLDVKTVLSEHLGKEFELVKVNVGNVEGELWWFRDHSIIAHPEIPLSERVEQAVVRTLKKQGSVDFTDVWEAVSILFPNSMTPDTTSIMDALKANARKTSSGKWLLNPEIGKRENQHNELIAVLAEIGKAWGYQVWIGRKEQPAYVGGTQSGTELARRKLAEYVDAKLKPFSDQIADLARAEQLDCIWVGPNGPAACFEVEATTEMTSGLMRGSNLLGKVHRYLAIPEERTAQLASKMKSPLFSERWNQDGWRVLYFDHLFTAYRRLKKESGRWELLEGFASSQSRQERPKDKQLKLTLS